MKDRTRHLRELELGEQATPSEIRQAYRDLARVWHPDRFANDPRMQAKGSEKLRRVIEAYEFLQSQTDRVPPPRREAQPRAERPRPQNAATPTSNRRDRVVQALADLNHRARVLAERVEALDRRAVTDWEHRAWIGIGLGMATPFALLFGATAFAREAMAPLWFMLAVSSVSLFVLAIYRSIKIREEVDDEICAVRGAEVTCGRCRRGVIGIVSPWKVQQALARAGWASENLKCPHCHRGLV